MSKAYTRLVPKPSPSSINSGLSNLKASTCARVLGVPSKEKAGTSCIAVSKLNPKLREKIVTEDVGPFRVTGHRAAVASLRRVFLHVKASDPELYEALGSAGMLCARLVRGSTSTWSNHSWGLAVDLLIDGKLDRRGDELVQHGLLTLYKHFHREGWFWGAEFNIEDGMHFEVAEQTFLEWEREGLL